MSATARARWCLLGAAVLFSTGGVAIKSCALSAWQVAALRSGIAALALVTLLPSARRSLTAKTWLAGTVYAATLVFFVLANKLTTSANAIFLQSSAPLYLLLLSPWLLRERIRARDTLVIAACAGGLLLFFLGDDAPLVSAPDPVKGNVLAACSGLSWAFTVVALRWLARAPAASGRDPALGSVVAGNLLAFAFALPFAWPFALPFYGGNATDWTVVGYLGVFQIGLAYWLVTRGLRHVSAFEGAILLLVEPALNPIWSWLALDEVPGTLALLGGALILGATLLKSWWDARDAAPAARSH